MVDNNTFDTSFTPGPKTDRKQEEDVYTNCIYDVPDSTVASFEMDDMYMYIREREEDEYDHLHTSRQKQSTFDVEENRYGTATHLEDPQTYSTAGQTKAVDSYLENEYSGMEPSLENLQSFENPDYDHCFQLQRPTDWFGIQHRNQIENCKQTDFALKIICAWVSMCFVPFTVIL